MQSIVVKKIISLIFSILFSYNTNKTVPFKENNIKFIVISFITYLSVLFIPVLIATNQPSSNYKDDLAFHSIS